MNTLQKQKWQFHIDAWAWAISRYLKHNVSSYTQSRLYDVPPLFVTLVLFPSHSDLILAAVNISSESIYTDDSHGRLYYCY